MTNREEVLCCLLDCQIGDLEALDDINYDLSDILDNINFQTQRKVTINGIIAEVFYQATSDLEEAVRDRIEELKQADELSAEEEEELAAISKLEPDSDVDYFINFTDSDIYLDNYDIYTKYFEDDMNIIEDNMGKQFEDTGN